MVLLPKRARWELKAIVVAIDDRMTRHPLIYRDRVDCWWRDPSIWWA